LIGDAVEFAKGDLFARLPLCVVAKVEENTHLKHDGSVVKGPYLPRDSCRKN
jgi:hypothetical protein